MISIRSFISQRDTALLGVMASSWLIFILVYFSPVTYAHSDPLFSLVVSQAIVEQQTIKLDAYYDRLAKLYPGSLYQVQKNNDHYYYNYPSGTSVFSLPFVAVARLLGRDMVDRADNDQVQRLISALLSTFVFILIYLIGSFYVEANTALAIALVSVMGTSLMSTMGTALWNMNFTVFFILLSLLLISRYDSKRSHTINGYLLGFLLFAAYFTRPSAALFILLTFAYLLVKEHSYRPAREMQSKGSLSFAHIAHTLIRKRILCQTTLTAGTLFVLFMAFSWFNNGQLLPFYYSASNWLVEKNILWPLYGVLFSASRGFFVFSPVFVLVIVVGLVYVRHVSSSLLFWLCGLWFTLQVITVSMTIMWWGGYSFGPRLLTDSVPALVMMTVILWQAISRNESNGRAIFLIKSAYLSLGFVSILVHSGQGLFNTKTADWNGAPPIEQRVDYLFDWRYPQFLITTNSFYQRAQHYLVQEWSQGQSHLTPYRIEDGFTHENMALFGWWPHDNAWYSEIKAPRLLFILETVNREVDYTLTIATAAREPHKVAIKINGVVLESVVIGTELTVHSLQFSGSMFKEYGMNEITLESMDPRRPSWQDIRDFRLYPLVFGPPQIQIAPVAGATTLP
jgi:hypothetical protein